MSKEGTMQPVGQGDDRMFGPRRLLCSGFTIEEQQNFLAMMREINLGDISILFAGEKHYSMMLQESFITAEEEELHDYSNLPRAIIMGGVSEKELHGIMKAFRMGEYPPVLWATITPTSQHWTLQRVLAELKREREEMQKYQAQQKKKRDS